MHTVVKTEQAFEIAIANNDTSPISLHYTNLVVCIDLNYFKGLATQFYYYVHSY